MAGLKAGTSADFSGSMAEAIEQAMGKEWQAVKGTALPSDGTDDRKLLWVAIANGVLNYLKTNQNDILTSITLDSNAASTVAALELNVPE
jgi:O-methyltransferase involved in polyketide biosynthesis